MKPPPLPDQNNPYASPSTQPSQVQMPPQQSMGDDSGMRLLLPVGRSGWAIIAGYLGLFGLVIFPAPLALIASLIAIWDIRKSQNSPRPKYGMGRAIFGLIVGIVGTAILVMLMLTKF